MAAGGGDFQSALGLGLPDNIGKIILAKIIFYLEIRFFCFYKRGVVLQNFFN
jgi:hypothetical protein